MLYALGIAPLHSLPDLYVSSMSDDHGRSQTLLETLCASLKWELRALYPIFVGALVLLFSEGIDDPESEMKKNMIDWGEKIIEYTGLTLETLICGLVGPCF